MSYEPAQEFNYSHLALVPNLQAASSTRIESSQETEVCTA